MAEVKKSEFNPKMIGIYMKDENGYLEEAISLTEKGAIKLVDKILRFINNSHKTHNTKGK